MPSEQSNELLDQLNQEVDSLHFLRDGLVRITEQHTELDACAELRGLSNLLSSVQSNFENIYSELRRRERSSLS